MLYNVVFVSVAQQSEAISKEIRGKRTNLKTELINFNFNVLMISSLQKELHVTSMFQVVTSQKDDKV